MNTYPAMNLSGLGQSVSQEPWAVQTQFVDRRLAWLDGELQKHFLGDDLDARCKVAREVGDTLFIATAGAPLDLREEALRRWRGKIVSSLLGKDDVQRFLSSSSPDLKQEAVAGEVPLWKFDALVIAFKQENERIKQEAINESKDKMREMLNSLVLDSVPDQRRTPEFVVIRFDGEVGFFRTRTNAMQWGRGSGPRFFMAQFGSDRGILPGL